VAHTSILTEDPEAIAPLGQWRSIAYLGSPDGDPTHPYSTHGRVSLISCRERVSVAASRALPVNEKRDLPNATDIDMAADLRRWLPRLDSNQ